VDALVKKGAEIPSDLKEKVEKYIEWHNQGVDRDVGGENWTRFMRGMELTLDFEEQ
jgi:hypothetical protein